MVDDEKNQYKPVVCMINSRQDAIILF